MAPSPLRFGIQTGQRNLPWAPLVAARRKAADRGADPLWNLEHFYPTCTKPEGPCHPDGRQACAGEVIPAVRAG